MENLCTLVLGDWSGDGHSMTTRYVIRSTLTVEGIKAAYLKGAAIIGVDVSQEVAGDDESIDEVSAALFTEAGMEIDPGHLRLENFLELYLFTVKVGEPTFTYEIVPDTTTHINIGGYGLFVG